MMTHSQAFQRTEQKVLECEATLDFQKAKKKSKQMKLKAQATS